MMEGYNIKQFAAPAVKYLIIINVVIYILGLLNPNIYSMMVNVGALHSWQSDLFYPWQFVTYMFLHSGSDFMHIVGNMFALYMFGSWLERVWGAKRFLFFYFFTGICAAFLYWGINSYQLHQFKSDNEAFAQHPTSELALSTVRKHIPEQIQPNFDPYIKSLQQNPANTEVANTIYASLHYVFELMSDTPTLGASGAIFAILMAFALLFPNTELMLLFPPIPIKAKYFVLFYGAFELYMQFKNAPDDNVAHLAHLSGMLFGFILVKYWNRTRNSFY